MRSRVWQEELLDEARFYQLNSLVALLEPVKHTFAYAADTTAADGFKGLLHWLGALGAFGRAVCMVHLGFVSACMCMSACVCACE